MPTARPLTRASPGDRGGTIRNVGTATVTRSTFRDLIAQNGAGVRNEGTLTLTDSVIHGNILYGYGGGVIRVVLVAETRGWVAFFSTDATATVADILGVVAERFSLETCFRDGQDVIGVGQDQVRHVWASVGSFHLCLWTWTLTEAWAWRQDAATLVDHRRASPWDDRPRRPSHADKRRAWRQEIRAAEIEAVVGDGVNRAEIRDRTERLLRLAA